MTAPHRRTHMTSVHAGCTALAAWLAVVLVGVAWLPAAAQAKGRGGHLIHRIFPGTFAAGSGSAERLERDRACRMAWQSSLTPERPSYSTYADYRKGHCARPHRPARVA
jgi:hypothetical protein